MKAHIRAEALLGYELLPGDLFSTVGPEYWSHALDKGSVGERVYIRTNALADDFPDHAAIVYRIIITQEETS